MNKYEGKLFDILNELDIFCMGSRDSEFKEIKKLLKNHFNDINWDLRSHSGDSTLHFACTYGHRDVVRLLLKNKDIDINQVGEYKMTPLHRACGSGHTKIVELLLNCDNIKVNQVADTRETALQRACRYGYTKVVEQLLNHQDINVNQVNNHETALYVACFQQCQDTINFLLSRADIIIDAQSYSYLEVDQQEYGNIIDKDTQGYLKHLTVIMDEFYQNNPSGVFDFPLDEAENPDIEQSLKGYYVLRHLIRCSQINVLSQLASNVDVLGNINRLLNIPSIKALVITNATSHVISGRQEWWALGDETNRIIAVSQTNEFLRLAQSVGHEVIVARLLDIPEIREAAEANNYYQGEAAYDLREVAQNRESSMRALTPQEQESVAQIERAYKKTVKAQGGAPKVVKSLKQTLKEKYLADEASRTVILGNASYLLPFKWSELQVFLKEHQVTSEQQQDILEIYYKNNNHTAYRYFSKPNRWMSDNANYVNSNRDGRWSTFDEYQPLIAYFWVAANDENQLPREANVTVADRVNLFVRQIALLNRGHNWDTTRFLMDEDGNSIEEEYDDLEGDKPSCYSGVKTRLFQSLLHHPCYVILDKAVTQQFIKNAIHEHYARVLNDDVLEDLQGLQDIVSDYFCDPDSQLPHEIEKLALTDMQRDAIKGTFIAHYGEKRAEAFFPEIDKLLSSDELIANHFLRFYQSAHLDKLLESMQRTHLARQIINEVVLTHVRKLAQPQTENEFEAVNQLLFAIKNQGIGCVWGEIQNVVKDQYHEEMQNHPNAPAWEIIKDSIDNVLLTSATQAIIQTEIKTDIKQSEGYRAYRDNRSKLDKKLLFWAKPESARWTLMGCVKAAVKEYQEKSRSSTKRKNEINAQVKEWKNLSVSDLAEELCTLFNTRNGSWSEHSFKALVAWHIYNGEEGLKAKQAACFENLPKKDNGIRHNCRWHGKQTVPLLCHALRAEFPAPAQDVRVSMI